MPYGMYISAAGAHTQSERLQVLSNNLANVDTPGFKRELAVFQARHSEAIERGEVEPGSQTVNDIGGGVRLAETVTDFSPGTLRRTGNKTDMAIEGEGFFVVEREGQQLLTRAGNFHISRFGELLTEQGLNVLNSDGDAAAIDPDLPWELSESGSIRQEGVSIPLAVVKPRSMGDLVKAGQNTFLPLADAVLLPESERRILTGFLEQSTVSPTAEMMELIETSRAYEANVKLIQNHDNMIGSLVTRVLRQ